MPRITRLCTSFGEEHPAEQVSFEVLGFPTAVERDRGKFLSLGLQIYSLLDNHSEEQNVGNGKRRWGGHPPAVSGHGDWEKAMGIRQERPVAGRTTEGAEDRRRFNRLSVSLPFAALKSTGNLELPAGLCTTDISPSGMLFITDGSYVPQNGAEVSFELIVPAGEGYSACEGRISGNGKVVRTQQLAEVGVGVGVQFTKPLSLKF